MKILVLSLLRLGDIIQQIPLLNGLRKKYPDAEIHLLLNKQFKSVEKILDGIADHYIYFDREAIQKGLGDAGYNILWSYTQVDWLIKELNEKSYDIALNFTHNKLSAYLLGALNIPDKRGLFQKDGRFQGLNNRWLKYFNERFSGSQPSLFHYIEILGKAFEIPIEDNHFLGPAKKKNKLILFQCLTSDSKKNWPLAKFFELKNSIQKALVDYDVRVLSAPFEKEVLSKTFGEKDLIICDLVEARKHLKNAELLVTGDTSIKHLAAQIGTPVVEIAIGSSDPTKTSAYTSEVTILQTSVACAPCSHSLECSQNSQICAEDISVHNVFAAVWDRLSGEKQKQEDLTRLFERSVWELYLDKVSERVEPFYGDAAKNLAAKIPQNKFQEVLKSWLQQTHIYRTWCKKASLALPSLESLSTKKNFSSADMAELILCAQEILKSKKDSAGYFQSFLEALLTRFTHPTQIHDRVTKALSDVDELLYLRENLIYHLQTISTEGVYYAKGIGQLSIRGFEEAREGLSGDLENSEL